MKKLLGIAVGVLFVASSSLASNTGFKLNYTLHKNPKTNNNWVSLPYFYYANGNVGDAQNEWNLCWDMNEGTLSPASALKVTAITSWDAVNDAPRNFSCGPLGIGARPLEVGKAYSMRPQTEPTVVNIVGSHDDDYSINKLNTKSVILHKNAKTNNNWVAIPYHMIANNQFELCKDLGVNPVYPPTTTGVGAIVKWDSVNDAPQSFSCTSGVGIGARAINPGEGVSMRPLSDLVPIKVSVY